jgi:hypothetical protein
MNEHGSNHFGHMLNATLSEKTASARPNATKATVEKFSCPEAHPRVQRSSKQRHETTHKV